MGNDTDWKKSTRSQASSDCVEVHRSHGLIRDSKNADSEALRGDVAALVSAIQDGSLRR
ncbi:MAG TPA: DUF397 domain-containing protein [Pseudonocardiaceae bacterium]|jgi:hypothetical protein|nr:DUF397 domain-containing protein [Pseudonocardiaceae bacterium]